MIGPAGFVECVDWLARALDALGLQTDAQALGRLEYQLAMDQSPRGVLRANLLIDELNLDPVESRNATGVDATEILSAAQSHLSQF